MAARSVLRFQTTARHPTNVTLPENLLREARQLNINVSQACERGLVAEVTAAKAKQWLQENREGIAAWNAYIEGNGLTLAEFKQF